MSTRALQRWPLTGRSEALELFSDALLDPQARGIVFYGPAGVGKSRLADECLDRAELEGRPTERATASRTAAAIPLAAVAHLLPATGEADAVELLARATDTLDERFGTERLILRIDDAHLLDASSAVLVEHLVLAGRVLLVATVRSGEAAPDVVTGLWRNHGLERIDLGPLPRGTVSTLLHRVLGGPLEAAGEALLWNASEGSPLYLSELVRASIDSGALTEVDGIWRLDHLDASSDRLVDLIESRLASIDPESREALEVLALCQPVAVAVLEERIALAEIERLEAAGLIQIRQSGLRTEAMLGHPIHAEVIRARVPAGRARRLLVREAERLECHGLRRREDALRVATWRLDAEGQADPRLLEQAALVARGAQDFAAVVRLARAALRQEPTAARTLLLGEALYETAQFAESEAVLADPPVPAADDRTRLLLLVTRSKNQFWGLLDAPAATELLASAVGTFAHHDEADQLLVELASRHTFSNRPILALETLEALDHADDARTRVVRAIGLSPALTAVGRTAEALAVAEQGFLEHTALGDELAIAHPGSHIVAQAFALTDAGRLSEAHDLAMAGHAITVADRSIIGQIWFALNLGRIAILQGHPATARRWYAEGTGLARATGFDGPRRLGLAGLAIAAGVLGDRAAADDAADQLLGLRPFSFLAAEQQMGLAWRSAAAGDVPSARRILRATAEEAATDGNVIATGRVAHDLARLGAPADAALLLREAADQSDSELLEAFAGHAAALVAGDPEQLTAVSDAFEATGALLLAAEAANAAADAWRSKREPRRAAALTGRASGLLARCEGARTPGSVVAEAVVPLSTREREVALLAADGVSSKDIAERLFLSVRTVHNHLQHVYAKLGVSSRPELAEALDRQR
ncbi:LuxR C-terminal-related transcriptional regulator [Aquihabitans sp. McL0605]|uniref:LuxR C-terminal-related transcriptional regulator n=1 Tax=Aquihabitans sp. McL0605 TaxID=3415671 RepID=UPI003CEDE563